MSNPPVIPLTDLAVPTLNQAQLDEFTPESMHASQLQQFDGQQAVEHLKKLDGRRVLAIDIGGDKAVTKLFSITDGNLSVLPDYEDYVQSDGGEGYMESLQRTAAYAQEHNLPVGISWGGPLDTTHSSKPLDHPKLKIIIEQLQRNYDGDFAQLLPTLTACINDSPAGLIAGAIEVNKRSVVSDIIFAINGGGLGTAVLADQVIYAAEGGHVRGVEALNKYHQSEDCGVYGATFICIERFGSNKGGIEAQWLAQTGSYMRAKDIESRYKAGDELARELYDNSALILAHMIKGTAQAFGIDLSSDKTAVVCHGSAFKFPHYGDRISQILEHNGDKATVVLTSSITPTDSNACLDGAAYAALLA